MLRELGGPRSGSLGWLLSATQDILPPDSFAALNHLVEQATDLAFRIGSLIQQFFVAIDQFLYEQREGRPIGMYSHQERILEATRTQPAWTNVELAWDETEHTLQPLVEFIAKLVQAITEINDSLAEEDDELFSSISNLYRRFSEMSENLNALVFQPNPERIYWVETSANGYASLPARRARFTLVRSCSATCGTRNPLSS